MNRRKLMLQAVTLIAAYALACTDLHELSLLPTRFPARAVRASSATVATTALTAHLSQQQVGSVLRAVLPSLHSNCWQPDRMDALAEPRLRLRLVIAANGDVTHVHVERAPTRFSNVAPCVAAGLRPLRFAEGSLGSAVDVSLAFSARAEPQIELWTRPLQAE